jgi:hypothetical protein
MTTLGVVLAVLVGAAAGTSGGAVLTWGILIFSGELRETPQSIRRSRLTARLFATAAVLVALATAGFVIGAVFGFLPSGPAWLWFAVVVVVVLVVSVILAMRLIERSEASDS